MKTRVLSITTLFPSPGTVGNFGGFVARQFDELAKRDDVDLTVIRPLSVAPWPLSVWLKQGARFALPFDDWGGYLVHHVRFLTVPRIGWRWNPALIARAALPLARKLHAKNPFDVVDTQFFFPDGPAAALIARKLGLPLSIKARGSDIHFWGENPAARTKMLAAANQAARILVVSEALKADMVALGMPEDKIAVHYTGLDHSVFRPIDRKTARSEIAGWVGNTQVPEDGKLLVSVGNAIPLKGQSLIIEALPQLPGMRLVLSGVGPEKANFRRRAAELGLTDRVHISYYRPEWLAVVLAAAEAMVLPSEREGLSNAWIEALACGTPLVISDVGGAREVVTAPSAGRLVERNAPAIAVGVADVLAANYPQAEVAAHAARFSWEANAAQLAAHYRLVAGAAPPSRVSRS